jgi:uncharacterized membrane protein
MELNSSVLKSLPIRNGFRLRGIKTSRLDTFSDAAFAFAMTMLVISVGNIPGSYQELVLALKGIPTFIASFALIMGFWIGHRSWSQRYGLEDPVSTFLSLAFVLIVLIYLYPLKIVLSTFFTWMSGGWLPTNFTLLSVSEIIGVFIIYGLGLAALAGCLALLSLRALMLSSELLLDTREKMMTKASFAIWLLMALTGFISALFAWLMPDHISVYAGFVYFTLSFSMPWITQYYKNKINKIV